MLSNLANGKPSQLVLLLLQSNLLTFLKAVLRRIQSQTNIMLWIPGEGGVAKRVGGKAQVKKLQMDGKGQWTGVFTGPDIVTQETVCPNWIQIFKQ